MSKKRQDIKPDKCNKKTIKPHIINPVFRKKKIEGKKMESTK